MDEVIRVVQFYVFIAWEETVKELKRELTKWAKVFWEHRLDLNTESRQEHKTRKESNTKWKGSWKSRWAQLPTKQDHSLPVVKYKRW